MGVRVDKEEGRKGAIIHWKGRKLLEKLLKLVKRKGRQRKEGKNHRRTRCFGGSTKDRSQMLGAGFTNRDPEQVSQKKYQRPRASQAERCETKRRGLSTKRPGQTTLGSVVLKRKYMNIRPIELKGMNGPHIGRSETS